MLTIPETKTETLTTPVSTNSGPGYIFADTPAVMKHSISCAIPEVVVASDADRYVSDTATVYAILPTDGVTCQSRDGLEYDMVSVLQDLGYWVKIWDPPVTTASIVNQPYIADTITDNSGFNDLLKLYALTLVNHEYVVLLDNNYILKKPLDSVFTNLQDTDNIAAYVIDPETDTIDMNMLVLKPNQATFEKLINAYYTIPYTDEGGWGETGVKGLGSSGIFTYFLLNNPDLPENGIELDRCIYANNADEICSMTPYEDVAGYIMSNNICGLPWMCTYDLMQVHWNDETKATCDKFLMHWVTLRHDFAEKAFNQPISDSVGQHHIEIYHGLCKGVGPEMYIPLVDQLPEVKNCIGGSAEFDGCDSDYISDTATALGSGAQLELIVQSPAQCRVYFARPNNGGAVIPFSGKAEISGSGVADTSMVFVIDRSGSACNIENLSCTGDDNTDAQHDDILDCEILAILSLVNKVREEGTISHVGFVSSSLLSATIELPLTNIHDVDGTVVNDIETAIRAVDCGEETNYAAAVEMACTVIDSSQTENNVVLFISDGLPTIGGSPAAYCENGANFHTIAIGGEATCESGTFISLMEIATSTGGTCQDVPQVPEIRLILEGIINAQFTSLKGSTIASENSVNFGCEDIPNFKTSLGMTCLGMGEHCSGPLAGELYADTFGNTGDSACCICGGGTYFDVGNLNQIPSNIITSEGTLVATTYEGSATMYPGKHSVCTTVTGLGTGVPGANMQCRNILVCPYYWGTV